MTRRVKLKQAAEITGLSEYEVRQGCISGKYPHMRVGSSRSGKIIIDLDLLEERLKELMIQNVVEESDEYGTLRKIR